MVNKVKHVLYLITLMIIIGSLIGAEWNTASAHATLQKQNPGENSTVQNVPEVLELEYNEPVYTEYTTLKVFDNQGKEIAELEPNESGQAKVVTFDSSDIKKGTYALEWETVSLDGHDISGRYQFSVGAPTASTIDTSSPIYTQTFFWFGLIRFIFQGSVLILTGLFIVNRFMSQQGAPIYDIIPKYRSAIWLLVMTAFSTGIVYLMTLPNDVINEILRLNFSTWLQFPFVISIVALIIILILFSLRNMEWIWYIIMSILILLAMAISGHVWTQSVPVYSILIRTLHLAGIAIWLGSFVYLISYLFKRPKHSYILIIKDTIFKLNVTSVVIIIVTGLLMSIDATTLSAILTQPTIYTFLWISKMIMTIVLMILGAYQTYIAMGQRRDINKVIIYIELGLGICLILAGVVMSQIEIPL
ncbi:copper resistance protein CopC [Staphylococcus felis]|uniref:copper resistance CopC/CopD family protein n=1 Tax=Staphylococcus felis TaxID=46127 RepID=UPI000CD1A5ED|nr:hypothetical protein C7J90_05150 [Staphylococcus felis]PNZ37602.1 hypothetical protein CD143_01920 [Staphylococcus felis]QQB03665.1 copper resistance protein CopC [Staphylococcus felis]